MPEEATVTEINKEDSNLRRSASEISAAQAGVDFGSQSGGSNAADLDNVFAEGDVVDIPDDVKRAEAVKAVEEPHIMFPVDELKRILSTVYPAKSAGSNIYDKSILLEPLDTEDSSKNLEYRITFSSFGIRYSTIIESNTPSPQNLARVPVIIDLDSLVVACKYSATQVLLYVRDNGIFASLFGGQAFTTSYLNAELAPYKSEVDMPNLGTPMDSVSFSGALQISSACRSQQSAQQKILYFTPDGSFVNSGGVFVRFATPFPDYAIQPRGVAVLQAYFKHAAKDITFGMDDRNLHFSDGVSDLMVEKVPDRLPDAVRDQFTTLPPSLTQISLQHLNGIVMVLSASSFEGGIADFRVSNEGVKIISKNKAGEDLSTFELGMPNDDFSTVTVSCASLKNTLPLFKGSMNLAVGVKEGTLALTAGNTTALIAGREK